MNKVISLAVVAAGLMFFYAPEAAAHEEVRTTRVVPAYDVDKRRHAHSRDYYERNRYERDYYRDNRAKKMPNWLKRKKSFRRWYKNTPLNRYRFLTWNQLYDIYKWERSYFLYSRH